MKLPVPSLEEILVDLRPLSRKLTNFCRSENFWGSLINVEIRRESQRNLWKVGFLIHLHIWPLWTLNPRQESVRPVVPQDGVRPLLSTVTEVLSSEWSCPLRPRMGIQSYARTRDKGNTTPQQSTGSLSCPLEAPSHSVSTLKWCSSF